MKVGKTKGVGGGTVHTDPPRTGAPPQRGTGLAAGPVAWQLCGEGPRGSREEVPPRDRRAFPFEGGSVRAP